MDITITNLTIRENHSGLLYVAECDMVAGRKKTHVSAPFIDMPMFDEKGNLHMGGVGDLLRRAYEETLRPPAIEKPAEKIPYEKIPEPVETQEIVIPAEVRDARREKLYVLQSKVTAYDPVTFSVGEVEDNG